MKDKLLEAQEMPVWLHALLNEDFFSPCSFYGSLKKNKKYNFCLDCCLRFCPHCLSSHAQHRFLRIWNYEHNCVVQVFVAVMHASRCIKITTQWWSTLTRELGPENEDAMVPVAHVTAVSDIAFSSMGDKSSEAQETHAWLASCIALEEYFTPCSVHESLKKNEKNNLCLDCCSSYCPHCLPSHDMQHRFLQIRRYMYNSVVRVKDLKSFDADLANSIQVKDKLKTDDARSNCIKGDKRVPRPNTSKFGEGQLSADDATSAGSTTAARIAGGPEATVGSTTSNMNQWISYRTRARKHPNPQRAPLF